MPSYKGFGLVDENIYPHYNKANEEQKRKIESYEKQKSVDISKMNDGEWFEETFLNNNIDLI